MSRISGSNKIALYGSASPIARLLAPVVSRNARIAKIVSDLLFILREEAVGIQIPSPEALGRLSPHNLNNVTINEFVDALESSKCLDIFSDGIYVLDLETNLLYSNASARLLYGSLGAKAPFPLSRVLTEESFDEAKGKIAEALAVYHRGAGLPREDMMLSLLKEDKTEIPIKVTPRLLKLSDGIIIIGTVTPSILSALVKLHEAIARQATGEIFRFMLDYAINLFRIDACAIKTDFDVENNSFNVPEMRNLNENYASGAVRRNTGKKIVDSLSYQACVTGEIIFQEALDDVMSAAVSDGMKSGIFVPLNVHLGKGEIDRLGAFCLYLKDRSIFESMRRKEQQLRLYADFIAREIRSARIHQRQIEESRRLDALLRISKDINSPLELDAVLDTLVRQAASIFEKVDNVRSASVYEVDYEEGVLRRRASIGRDASRMDLIQLDDEKSTSALVARTGDPLIVPDVAKYYKSVGAKGKVGQGSFLNVPIKVDGRVIAVLNIASMEENYFDSNVHLPTAMMLAQMAAIAISKASQHEEIIRQNKEKELLLIRDTLIHSLLNGLFGPYVLELELREAMRRNQPYSVLMLDIDFFKNVNDTYGHLAGNSVLQGLGGLMKEAAKGLDVVYRFGGEEFVIGIPNCGRDDAFVFAERLRNLVRDHEFVIEPDRIRITISIGIATYPTHGSSLTALVGLADQAMYVAKETGRDRVVVQSF